MQIIAGIENPDVIEKILKHLGLDEAHRPGIAHRQKDLKDLKHGVSFTDACVDWATT